MKPLCFGGGGKWFKLKKSQEYKHTASRNSIAVATIFLRSTWLHHNFPILYLTFTVWYQYILFRTSMQSSTAQQSKPDLQHCAFCHRGQTSILCRTCGHCFRGRVRSCCDDHPSECRSSSLKELHTQCSRNQRDGSDGVVTSLQIGFSPVEGSAVCCQNFWMPQNC